MNGVIGRIETELIALDDNHKNRTESERNLPTSDTAPAVPLLLPKGTLVRETIQYLARATKPPVTREYMDDGPCGDTANGTEGEESDSDDDFEDESE